MILQDFQKTLFSTGKNNRGQLGLGHKKNIENFEKIIFFQKKKIFITNFKCGKNHVLAITDKKKFYGWGDNRFFQISKEILEKKKSVILPNLLRTNKFPMNLKTDIQIACGGYSSFILFSNKKLFYFGKISGKIEVFSKNVFFDFFQDDFFFPIFFEIEFNNFFEIINFFVLDGRESFFEKMEFEKLAKQFFFFCQNKNFVKFDFNKEFTEFVKSDFFFEDSNKLQVKRFSLQVNSLRFLNK